MKSLFQNHTQAARPCAGCFLVVVLLLGLLAPPAASAQPGTPLWTNRFVAPLGRSGADHARAVAVDTSGNIFVTGYAGADSIGFLTLAYSNTGVPLWTNRYENPEGSTEANGIAVDGAGNVIVTGGASKYEIIKYSGMGMPLWTNRYRHDNGMTGDDRPTGVAVDAPGDIVVTGYSYGMGYDWATIKYSSMGLPLWTNRFSGPGDGSDWVSAVAVDPNGNVIVTGSSDRGGLIIDYATIKYSSAGVPLWTNYYGGAGQADDQARAVAVDTTGNVFVTGGAVVTGDNFDFITIAYTSSGVPLWTNRYDGPASGSDGATAVTVDGNGNVIVAGNSNGSNGTSDYATVKYSNTGVPLWTNRYNGPANDFDILTGLATDNSGNVFVTGYSQGTWDSVTIKYSSTGTPLWTRQYAGLSAVQINDLALDANGNVFVTGASDGDFATVAYSNTGVASWTNLCNWLENDTSSAIAVASDLDGNVYVTGTIGATGYNQDYATIKYSSMGVPLWTNRYGGAGNDIDQATSLAVDASGNVFVTGTSADVSSSYDYATVKYSSAGVPLWTNRYNGPANSSDNATAVAMDQAGNIFVTGYSQGLSSQDYATIAYSNGGVPLWTNRYNGPANSTDQAGAVTVDGNGDVIVTGRSRSVSSFDDYATIKYSAAGVPLWTNRYNGPANGLDQAVAVAMDGNGDIIVTGTSLGIVSGTDYATIKYSSAGVPLWTNRYNASGAGAEQATSVAVDGNGGVIVTGTSFSSGNDYATIKYSAAGVPLWTNRYKGPGTDEASRVALDSVGNVFVTGRSTDTGFDYATIAYSSAGVPLWTNRYNGPAEGTDGAVAITVDANGDVLVTGGSVGFGTRNDFATIKYAGMNPGLPPFRISEFEILTNGHVRIRHTGLPGLIYRLERASDITGANGGWPAVGLTVPMPPAGFLDVIDTNPPPNAAYYRSRLMQ